MMLIELTAANIGRHIDELMLIEQEAFAQPWSREAYLEEAERPISHLVALVEDGRLVGYAGFWQVLDEADVNNVAVAAACRGQGLGRLLMGGLLDMARLLGCTKVNLEVRAGNAAAIALYRGCGFVACGCRPGYYQDNHEDALLMQWTAIDKRE